MTDPNDDNDDNYFDVLIVGAGISGISMAYHLQTECPNKTFLILEGRHTLGGTWDLFQYPGVRSDSDMHTLGFAFKPWVAPQAIAGGPLIQKYIEETVDQFGIRKHMRFHHFVESASWDSSTNQWTLTVQIKKKNDQDDNDESTTTIKQCFRCNFLSMCSGYYSYTDPYNPDFPGRERFQGTVVHPQFWPKELDYTDKTVVVIGSGATAMTIVPAMAENVKHITMLQRSPTYVASWPDTDSINNFLRKILPESWAYGITRWKNIWRQEMMYKEARKNPTKFKATVLDMVRKGLEGSDCDVDKHFNPTYDPWDQRFCLLPNDDLFLAIKSGKASMVTDTIETWTESGIQLTSGDVVEADIIVTATGLRLSVLGQVEFSVDGAPVDASKTYTYKGMGYSGVPNLVTTFGYINASWTLRADLTSKYICRLLQHMDETGTRRCTPTLPAVAAAPEVTSQKEEEKKQKHNNSDTQADAKPKNTTMAELPFIQNFSSGYMQRDMHRLPKQSGIDPWVNTQDYSKDKKLCLREPIDDGVMVFAK